MRLVMVTNPRPTPKGWVVMRGLWKLSSPRQFLAGSQGLWRPYISGHINVQQWGHSTAFPVSDGSDLGGYTGAASRWRGPHAFFLKFLTVLASDWLWIKPRVKKRTQTLELDRLELEFRVHYYTLCGLEQYFASLDLNLYTHKLGIIAYTVVSLNFNIKCKIFSKVLGKENV